MPEEDRVDSEWRSGYERGQVHRAAQEWAAGAATRASGREGEAVSRRNGRQSKAPRQALGCR